MTLPHRKATRLVCAISAALLLGACATNSLRLDYAQDVAAQGQAAATAADAFLDTVEDARIAANVELAASDPNCLPRIAHVRMAPDLSQTGPDGTLVRGWLCASGAEPGTVPLSMVPPGREFEPTLQLIAALGAYSEAIAHILAEDGSEQGERFGETLALLQAAAGTMGALGGDAGRVVPAADDPRFEAIQGFVAFVSELASEQRKVDQLRTLIASPEGSAELAGQVQDHLIRWDTARRSDLALQATLASSVMSQAFRAEPPAPPETRRELITAYYARERGAREEMRAYSVLGALFTDLARADSDMRRVLAEDPDLTPAERTEVARALQRRVAQAFETATALLTAF